MPCTTVSSLALALPPGARAQLAAQLRLALGARHELFPAERELDGADPGCRAQPRGRTANELEQQPAILDGHPAGAERDVRVLPVMCRHAPAVSLDDDALARTLHLARLAVHAERRVLEAPAEILCPHAVEQRRQALVELRLIRVFRLKTRLPFWPGGRTFSATAA